MVKLKELIKESAWDRKFGESLPTLEDVVEKHQNEAVEQDVNLSFKVMGIRNNDMVIEGKKVKLVLSFKGDDLKNAIEGKSNRKGKVTLASVNIK